MADFLINLSKNPTAKGLLGRVGVPLPVPLRRADGPWTERPLEGRVVVVGGAAGALLHPAIATTLGRAGARATLVGQDEAASAYAEAAEAWGRPLTHVDAAPDDLRADAVVFDGTGMTGVADLRALYDVLQPLVRRVQKCGRVVVIGLDPAEQTTAGAAAAHAALDGFVRSLGKELGRKGVTVNRLMVRDGAEERVEPALRWLLSDRSAFVDLQTLPLSAGEATDGAPYTRPLDGKTALVTGAARGIGAATARRLADEGAKVMILDRPDDLDAAASLARELEGVPLGLDITDADAGPRLAAAIDEHLGGLDVLVHNAGVTRDKTLGRMDPDRWDLAIAVNLAAVLDLTAHLDQAGALRDGGRVVLLSSIAGLAGNAGQTNYAASKAGLVGALGKLAPALGQRGVTVNAIAPGFIETRMTAAIPAAIREVGRRLSALSQGGLPRDIADAVTFLASPGAAGVQGAVLRVCGGSFIGA